MQSHISTCKYLYVIQRALTLLGCFCWLSSISVKNSWKPLLKINWSMSVSLLNINNKWFHWLQWHERKPIEILTGSILKCIYNLHNFNWNFTPLVLPSKHRPARCLCRRVEDSCTAHIELFVLPRAPTNLSSRWPTSLAVIKVQTWCDNIFFNADSQEIEYDIVI